MPSLTQPVHFQKLHFDSYFPHFRSFYLLVKPHIQPFKSLRLVSFFYCFWKKNLMRTMSAFVGWKNPVKIMKYYNNCFISEYIVKCNLFLWSKLNFQHHYSSVQCHMILYKSCWFAAQETFLIIINDENMLNKLCLIIYWKP